MRITPIRHARQKGRATKVDPIVALRYEGWFFRRLFSPVLDDPRKIPYLFVWKRPEDSSVREVVRVFACSEPPANSLGIGLAAARLNAPMEREIKYVKAATVGQRNGVGIHVGDIDVGAALSGAMDERRHATHACEHLFDHVDDVHGPRRTRTRLYREILRAFIAATSEGALVNWTEKL